MKFKTNILCVVLLSLNLICCKSEFKEPTENAHPPELEIVKILEDSISIRALDYGGGKYWFAGSHGKFGYINSLNDSVSLFTIDVENNLEFRSIAVTSNYTYILTAGNPALVYKISQENNSIDLVYTERGEKVFYDSMKFWNDNEGIAMGDPQNGCFSIIKTKDGGKTWQKIKCDNMPEALSGEAAFAASNSNLDLIGNKVWFTTGGSHARVFHSVDKGLTWTVYKSPVTSGEQMTGIYATNFYDENLGVIIGGDWNKKQSNEENKAITYDGGKTWQLLSNKSGPGYCSDILFVPDTKGQELLSVGSPGVWWSGDQGESWSQLSGDGFYTVYMINSQEGYLAGRHRLAKLKLRR